MSSSKKRKHDSCCTQPCSCSSSYPKSPPKSCPAYGNFFNNTSLVTVLTGTAFPFNMQGPIAGGVSLLNPTTIFIENGGDYRVNFVITDNTVVFGPNSVAFPHLPTVSLFLNNVQVPLEQANFGLEITQAEGRGCKPIVGDTILSIPDNSILELRNITTQGPITTIITCGSVGNNVQLSRKHSLIPSLGKQSRLAEVAFLHT